MRDSTGYMEVLTIEVLTFGVPRASIASIPLRSYLSGQYWIEGQLKQAAHIPPDGGISFQSISFGPIAWL